MSIVVKVANRIHSAMFRNHKFNRIGKSPYVAKGCIIQGCKYISIGNNFHARENLMLQTWDSYQGVSTEYIPELEIGDDVTVMSNCQISCLRKVQIGSGCLFGDNVFISDNLHGSNISEELGIPPLLRKLSSKGPIIIGDNVWIGRNVCVLPGVKIGNGVVIGANSVVTHDIPENSVAAGVPAKVIKVVER